MEDKIKAKAKEVDAVVDAGRELVHELGIEAIDYMIESLPEMEDQAYRIMVLDQHARYVGVADGLYKLVEVRNKMEKDYIKRYKMPKQIARINADLFIARVLKKLVEKESK